MSAALFGTAGHGTVSMTGFAPGPAKVATRMSGLPMVGPLCAAAGETLARRYPCSFIVGTLMKGGTLVAGVEASARRAGAQPRGEETAARQGPGRPAQRWRCGMGRRRATGPVAFGSDRLEGMRLATSGVRIRSAGHSFIVGFQPGASRRSRLQRRM